jgi:hypothetical protein
MGGDMLGIKETSDEEMMLRIVGRSLIETGSERGVLRLMTKVYTDI